ncbi:NACHT domain-containing protein [Steroidobacter flavus]|uniref:NACHT domain-containing protein n=1 Tax=Steroidobacter flavus TaxID=1842136 RepID=A0ABV8T5U7_9GAMM
MPKRPLETVGPVNPSLPPPVKPRHDTLPFHGLSWVQFERLVLRLLQEQTPNERYERLGREGQDQHGIDIFCRRSANKYHCWQVKNREATGAVINDAINEFLRGTWAGRTEKFTLCFRAGLNDTTLQELVEQHTTSLEARGIQFKAIDDTHLTHDLRQQPHLVAEFFGTDWLKAFLGEEVAQTVRIPPGAAQLQSLRQRLHKVYEAQFRQTDAGFTWQPAAESRDPRNRFVQPDVDAKSPFSVPAYRHYSEFNAASQFATANNSDNELDGLIQAATPESAREDSERKPLADWLTTEPKQLLIGSAGLGKSTILRCLALDLLSSPRSFPQLTERFGDCLPLFIPFAQWTRLTTTLGRDVSIEEIANHRYARLVGGELDALIEDSLRNGRLVLLIDGLDEYADEQAGRATLATLSIVVQTRGAIAICSARTAAVRTLGLIGSDWSVARLHELTMPQQKEFVGRLAAADSTSDTLTTVDRFRHDLEQISALRSLAGTPLLLSWLFAVWRAAGRLPQTRYQLFETFIELLLETHPTRRATAAAEVRQGDSVFTRDAHLRKSALARLAFQMQQTGTGNGTGRLDARKIIERFLSQPREPGWDRERARQGAFELIDGDSNIAGALLERVGDEIAFRHAALREHLAGIELSRRRLEDQCQFAAENADDPRWRASIIALVQSARSQSSTEAILKAIRGREACPPDMLERRLLLAEAAFTVGTTAGSTGTALAAEALDRVEDGLIEIERAQTLQLAMDGPQDGRIGGMITDRLQRWCPCVSGLQDGVFEALAEWSPRPDLRRTLWIGLRDHRYDRKYLAAAALAQVFAHDRRLPSQLKIQMSSAQDADTAASSLYALLLGWPKLKTTRQMMQAALASDEKEIRAVGALIAYRRGSRSKAVRTALIDTIDSCVGLDQDAAEALWAAWPDEDLLRTRYWHSLEPRTRRVRVYQFRHALSQLAGSRKDKRRVGQWLETQFADRAAPQPELFECAEVLLPLLRTDSSARIAIERWIRSHPHDPRTVALLNALIPLFRSRQSKEILLADLARGARAQAESLGALLKGWGSKDRAVRGALASLSRAPAHEIQHHAQHLSDVLPDRKACRARLLDIARLPEVRDLNHLIEGFTNNGIRADDSEVAAALMAHTGAHPEEQTAAKIIRCLHRAPRVRELALTLLDRAPCPLATILRVYEADPEISTKALSRAAPLPPYLRRIIADRAAQRVSDPRLRRSLLALSEGEDDRETQSIATVGLCNALTLEAADTTALRMSLLDDLNSNSSRRRDQVASISGLIALGHLDAVLETIKQRARGPIDDKLRVVYMHDTSATATGLLAEHWEAVESALGKNVNKLLCGSRPDDSLFWVRFAPHVARSPALKAHFLRHCEEQPWLGTAEITALAQLPSERDLLLDGCCRTLTAPRPSWSAPYQRHIGAANHAEALATAAGLLASTFAADERALTALERAVALCRKWGHSYLDIPFIGLAATWPDHPLVKQRAEALASGSLRSLSSALGGSLWIAGQHFDTRQFTVHVITFVTRDRLSGWDFASDGLNAIRARLTRDADVRAFFLNVAFKWREEAGICASFPRLLATSNPLTPEQLRVFERLLADEDGKTAVPRFGIDATVNRFRPVLDCLADSLGVQLASRCADGTIARSVKKTAGTGR